MGETDFWNNPEQAKSTVAELKVIKAVTEPIDVMLRGIDDARALCQLAEEAGDQESMAEADRMLAELEKKGEKVELQTLLDGKNDHRNAFFTIQAGAGGTEAQDWAEMLLRMYLYFFESRGWGVAEIDRQYGEQAGIKSVTLHV
ncbi:MAG TPA: PCRF domain-containing protein, partial [Tepidisphaeraceae bacterium]